MAWRTGILLAVLAALSPYLYDLGRVVRILIINDPEKLPKVANFTAHATLFGDHMRNCEDMFMDSTSGFAIVSCNPGRDDWNTVMVGSPPPEFTRGALVERPQGNYVDSSGHGSLYLYRYADAADKPPALIPLEGFDAPFHPLGVTYHRASQTLAVANHGGEQASVEVFTLEPKVPRALFRQSISDPAKLPTPNSLVFLNATHLYASNSHQIATFSKPSTLTARLRVNLAWLEHRLGLPTGSVSLIDLATKKVTKVLRQSFANGVDLLDDGQTMVVAGTTLTPKADF
ncbi:hypothetical protein ACRE_061160 [Hapsidospora chrysogenum ATCC 11550]|uniref:Serum paraoxonase/arylesterase-like protein n=1 Tax=Hapsidospora chrysogenum (strain ATCC 11550 / CBS 779.69 / DSM 880 / IAM 14645 / JCM 23072 / IMI 49137) TaxID=857340 RepID=A0A086T1D1_HAPC1|nr:hypothetical protein ACRE_061160 [Hapsidospora chrysogenum ATCC 11550]